MLDKYKLPFPRVVRIEPAEACNLACSHCPTGTVDMQRGIMKPATFARIMESLSAHNDAVKVVVLYHGGEPFLNKHFVEMLRQVKKLGQPFVKVNSNGTLLPERIMEGIVNHGLDEIMFSIDGDSPEQNNFIRRNVDYETVVGNIKRFIDYKLERKTEFPKVTIAHARFLDPVTYRGQKATSANFLVEEFSGRYAGQVTFNCAWAVRWPNLNVQDKIYDVFFDPYDNEPKNHCDHVINTMTIRADGKVVACCYDITNEHVLGNIHDENLAAIWNNEKYLMLRRSIEQRTLIPMCEHCNMVNRNTYLLLKPHLRDLFSTSSASRSAPKRDRTQRMRSGGVS